MCRGVDPNRNWDAGFGGQYCTDFESFILFKQAKGVVLSVKVSYHLGFYNHCSHFQG